VTGFLLDFPYSCESEPDQWNRKLQRILCRPCPISYLKSCPIDKTIFEPDLVIIFCQFVVFVQPAIVRSSCIYESCWITKLPLLSNPFHAPSYFRIHCKVQIIEDNYNDEFRLLSSTYVRRYGKLALINE
jgi:hypothetical protein